MKGSKKGGVMISMLVGYERPKPREDEDDPVDTISASLVYYIHKMVVFGSLVAFLAALVRSWLSIGYRKFCGIRG